VSNCCVIFCIISFLNWLCFGFHIGFHVDPSFTLITWSIAGYDCISLYISSGNSCGISLTGLKSGVTELPLTILKLSPYSTKQVVCIAGSIVSWCYVLSVVSILESSSAADVMLAVAFLPVNSLCYGVNENCGIPFG